MPHDILIATEAELRRAVALDLAAVDAVERAFAALAAGGVVMPPVLSMAIPQANGEVDVKTAYLPGFEGFAIKVSPGFFDNPKLGLPSLNGLMILFSARTGLVEALFLDNGYLTDVRTAAAGAVAARHLAPAEVSTAGVMGTGVQARLQMQAAHLVRPFRRVLVWGRDPAKAAACADRYRGGARHRGAGRGRSGAAGGREPAGGDHDAGAIADPARGLAASGAACHGDGVGPGREERDRAPGAGGGRRLRLRPGQPVREARRAAQRRCGGRLDPRRPCPSSAPWWRARCGRGAATRTSPSAT